MKSSELQNTINDILRKIQEGTNSIHPVHGKIPAIETDRLKKLCIDLYDLILQLEQTPAEKPLEVIMPEPEEVKPVEMPVISPKPEIPPVIDSPGEFVAEVETAIPAIRIKEEEIPVKKEEKVETVLTVVETEVESEPEVVAVPPAIEPEPVVEVRKTEPEISKEPATPIREIKHDPQNLFDASSFKPVTEKPPVIHTPVKPVSTEKNLHEKLSETKKEKTIHDVTSSGKNPKKSHHFQSFRISRIVDAIDISKRFELQNNLFGRDPQVYIQSINSLEKCVSLEGAMNLIQQMSKQYHWDMEDDLVQELISFLERKFQE